MSSTPSLQGEADKMTSRVDEKVQKFRSTIQDHADAANQAVEKALASLKRASDDAENEQEKAKEISEKFNDAIKKAMDTLEVVQKAASSPTQSQSIALDKVPNFADSAPETPTPDYILSPLNLMADDSPILTPEKVAEEKTSRLEGNGKVLRTSGRKKSSNTEKAAVGEAVTLAPRKQISKN
jgi:cysteinyl-tRNA synthetase